MNRLLVTGMTITFVLISLSSSATEKKMLLVGGALKICSSYAKKNCKQEQNFDQSAYTDSYYSITAEKIKIIQKNEFNVFDSSEKLAFLIELLNKYLARNTPVTLTRPQLLEQLDDMQLTNSRKKGRAIIESLTDTENAFLFQFLQQPVSDKNGKALTEYVVFSQSNEASQQIVSRYVDLVKSVSDKKRPLILVSTASANDVFDAVSFYLQLFKSFEVDVAWLPIEASLTTVMNSKQLSCSALNAVRSQQYAVFNRNVIFPKLTNYQQKFCEDPTLLNQLVERASGLFINGGDQFLTLSSLAKIDRGQKIFSPLYQLIKQRFDKGLLVVAGTSAGTAVQSGGQFKQKSLPMITNGESLQGLFQGSTANLVPPKANCETTSTCGEGASFSSLTVFSAGGLELLPVGLIDTHFSKRDRAFRMSRLLADNQIEVGIGIDENTALVINATSDKVNRYDVIGEGSVWWFDASEIKFTPSPLMINNLTVNVFPSGSAFEVSESQSLITQKKVSHRLGEDVLGRLIGTTIAQNKVDGDCVVSDKTRKAKLAINLTKQTFPLSFRLNINEIEDISSD